jgi:hypothetical protein
MNDDIDYLHPDGKPLDSAQEGTDQSAPKQPLSEDARPSARELDRALHEADGHSIYKPDPFLDGDETEPPKWDVQNARESSAQTE